MTSSSQNALSVKYAMRGDAKKGMADIYSFSCVKDKNSEEIKLSVIIYYSSDKVDFNQEYEFLFDNFDNFDEFVEELQFDKKGYFNFFESSNLVDEEENVIFRLSEDQAGYCLNKLRELCDDFKEEYAKSLSLISEISSNKRSTSPVKRVTSPSKRIIQPTKPTISYTKSATLPSGKKGSTTIKTAGKSPIVIKSQGKK